MQRTSLVLWVYGWACLFSSGQSLATSSPYSPTASKKTTTPSVADRLDGDALVHAVRSGRVYQHTDFLSPTELEWILADVQGLRDAKPASFTRSGLSDTSRTAQGFGQQDRSVSPVPWWKETLLQEEKGHINSRLPGNDDDNASNLLAPRLHELRHFLADRLGRPTMHRPDLAHECYYSISGPGSFLPRHMDEKHEEFKGAKGWLLSSRRSVSWLLYLSDPPDWNLATHGGALRAYPPRQVAQPREPTHQGNLQIGWLHQDSSSKGSGGSGSRPVYLDSWFQPDGSSSLTSLPHAILYTLSDDDGNEHKEQQQRIALTKPWRNDNLPPNVLPMDFLQQMATHDRTTAAGPLLFLRPHEARQFALLEDRSGWEAGQDPAAATLQDVAPLRNSLVVFDSVLLPHQVQEVLRGERVALAGWFHEVTQEFPTNTYDTEGRGGGEFSSS